MDGHGFRPWQIEDDIMTFPRAHADLAAVAAVALSARGRPGR
jgi:hypothetical protein